MKDSAGNMPQGIELWNALAASMGARLPLAGRGRAVLQLAPDALAGLGPVFAVSTPEGRVLLQMKALPVAAMTQSTLGLDEVAALPPALGDAVLALLAEMLKTTVGGTAAALVESFARATAADIDAAGGEAVLAEVDGGWGATAQVLLRADRQVWAGLAGRLIEAHPRAVLPDAVAALVQTRCTLRMAGRDLALARLHRLQVGDVILPDRSKPQGSVLALWTPQARFGLSETEGALMIDEVAMNDEFPESEAMALPVAEVAGDIPDAGHLPVRVSFVLAEQVLTLAELQGLAVGAVLPFAASPPAAGHEVRILGNGRPIGTGHVIEIEGRPAVRIARFFGVTP